MDKLQILFPEQQLTAMRRLASKQQKPVSEVVRTAVAIYLKKHARSNVRKDPPVFHAGKIRVSPAKLRESAYDDTSR